MNWEAVGAVAEILGAVAVVASLLYLGRQIHQANAQSQADARYSFLDAYGLVNAIEFPILRRRHRVDRTFE